MVLKLVKFGKAARFELVPKDIYHLSYTPVHCHDAGPSSAECLTIIQKILHGFKSWPAGWILRFFCLPFTSQSGPTKFIF